MNNELKIKIKYEMNNMWLAKQFFFLKGIRGRYLFVKREFFTFFTWTGYS